jgi:hypothetical protein
MPAKKRSRSHCGSGAADGLPDWVGYRVETSHGPLRVVAELCPHGDWVSELVVRAGKQGSRLLILPASDITKVIPAERRITLRSRFHLTTSEGLSRSAGRAETPAS